MSTVFGKVVLVCVLLISGIQFAQSQAEDSVDNSGLSALVTLLGQVEDPAIQLDLLTGMFDALEGRRDMKMPAAWPEVSGKLTNSSHQEVRDKATQLALIFGDQKAIALLRSQMIDRKLPFESRRRALFLLSSNQVKGLDEQLFELLDDPDLCSDAIRGLAAFSNSKTPSMLLNRYGKFSPSQRADAIQSLATRSVYAAALLDAIDMGVIAPAEVSAFAARQIDSLADASMKERLRSLWGDVSKTSSQQKSVIDKYKRTLTDDYLSQANLVGGRMLFDKHCKSCHTLYGEGGKIGPDITGSNRNNLDYILENVLAPSVAVPRAYQMNVVVTVEGRVLNGIIVAQTPQTITLQTVNERIVLDRNHIEQLNPSPLSMMPDGLFEKMSGEEVRDLIAYLREKQQIPLAED